MPWFGIYVLGCIGLLFHSLKDVWFVRIIDIIGLIAMQRQSRSLFICWIFYDGMRYPQKGSDLLDADCEMLESTHVEEHCHLEIVAMAGMIPDVIYR